MTSFRLFGLPFPRRRSQPPPPAIDLSELAVVPEGVLLARLGTCRAGLSNHDVAVRYREHGPNLVAGDRPVGTWHRLAQILANPLSLVLATLAAVSWATGSRQGALVIVAMVALSSLLAFVREHRSARAAESLRAMVHVKATLVRRIHAHAIPPGVPQTVAVPLLHVVPGDIVLLSAGNLVPGDVRVLAAKDLYVDQAALTGESMPVEKSASPAAGPAPPLEVPNLAFMGTYVQSGSGTAVVLATGARTHFGRLARAVAARRGPTEFDRGVNRYLWLIVRFMMVLVPAVLLINGLTKGDWLEALLFAVAVAVGMTPEMLPMVITVNLAKGALAMAGERVIVKRLGAIQEFGAMDVLATDKTGTLTQNRVLLERHVDVAGRESQRVLEFACLASFFQSGTRNLLDEAVLTHAELHEHIKSGAGFRKVDEIPFDFARRRSSVVVETADGNAHLLICKGAVDQVARVCTQAERDGRPEPFAAPAAGELHSVARELNEEGFRVLAVAWKEVPAGPANYEPADESGMVLLGYIAFLDPPKESAGPAIQALRERGVTVKVLTGDNELVARHVCRQVGLAAEPILLGAEIDALSDDELAARCGAIAIFARTTPQQKARVIRTLRAAGHVVGYLGDGINDGPALKAADVGISVDSAADVAKWSADIVLLENSLAVLCDGVVQGRRVFANVTKYLRMAGSSTFGTMFSMVGASALLPFLPMAPVQILVNNLLYDLSQTALATDDVDADFVREPRRWDIGGIGRYMVAIGPVSSLFDYATFALMAWFFHALGNPSLFQTGWFIESLLSQTLVVHVIRTNRIPFVESKASRALVWTTIAVCAFGVVLPHSPLAGWLGLTPLPWNYWPALGAILVGYLALVQFVKSWVVRRFALD
jgi:Mg2+-importing ATPase